MGLRECDHYRKTRLEESGGRDRADRLSKGGRQGKQSRQDKIIPLPELESVNVENESHERKFSIDAGVSRVYW
jgi:hypothetical protein